MLIHSWCNEPASCVVMLVHCASCVVKVRALLGRSAPDPQKLVPMPTPRSWNPRRHSKPSGTSGFWWERPCLRSMCLRVCVVVDVTKPLLQLISVYFVRCKELPFCSFSCSLLGAWPYFHGLIYTDGTGPGWQWQASVEWWSCLATCFFFGKRKFYLFQTQYIKMIHRLEIFPTSVWTTHSLIRVW